MIRLQVLCEDLKSLLEVDAFQDSCLNGLQVEGTHEVRTLAVAVTASLAVIEQAVKLKVDLLLVHHGLFWDKDSPAVVGVKKQKLALLLKNNISLLSYHLPLDAHPLYGNNYCAAKAMGWQDLQPFWLYNGRFIGVKGSFPKCSVEDFQKNLEEFYDHPAHTAKGGPPEVETAALISGGAYRLIDLAIKEGVDCFITGNFDEPAWHQAKEGKIHFFAMGHSATETIGPRALAQYIHTQYGLPWTWIEENNPF